MKVEKSISMYLHAFQQPCKHQIVTDPKSCNASHMLTISSLLVGCRNTVLSHSSLRQSEKSLCEYFMLFSVVLAIEAKDISNIKEIGYSINIIMEEHSFVKNQSLIHFHVFLILFQFIILICFKIFIIISLFTFHHQSGQQVSVVLVFNVSSLRVLCINELKK